uniref:BRO1 domain-containing protein BROX n=1 Tax=Petromyzon marinus TaxID=7757 RepID=A0AAJ7SLN4_PETMA|nr:BRO1 domain-containing protein BROX isoform X2 [Petromyzon marinus]
MASYWFHRNPFKWTAPVAFDYSWAVTHKDAHSLCRSLREGRGLLLKSLVATDVTEEKMTEIFTHYVSLLLALGTESKLRFLQKFSWNSSITATTWTQQDALYEICCVVHNHANWLSRSPARISNAELTMEDAKQIHCSLKLSSGYYKLIQEELVPRLVTSPERGSDLHPDTLLASRLQVRAEAQEVTVARALELGHAPGLLTGLCKDTAAIFKMADDSLAKVKLESFTKWRNYLQLKEKFYLAYARVSQAKELLACDRCGDSISSLQHAQKYYQEAERLSKSHGRARGTGAVLLSCSLYDFFTRLGRDIDTALQKSLRENGFIYFHKVPDSPPDLDSPATFGCVEPPEVELPPASDSWSVEAYTGFDLTKTGALVKEKEQEVKILKEPDLKPNKEARCSIA